MKTQKIHDLKKKLTSEFNFDANDDKLLKAIENQQYNIPNYIKLKEIHSD